MSGYIVGTLDTKGAELCYLRDRVADAGVETTLVDVSTSGDDRLARWPPIIQEGPPRCSRATAAHLSERCPRR